MKWGIGDEDLEKRPRAFSARSGAPKGGRGTFIFSDFSFLFLGRKCNSRQASDRCVRTTEELVLEKNK